MDFLKKLLFLNKGPNRKLVAPPVLDLAEEVCGLVSELTTDNLVKAPNINLVTNSELEQSEEIDNLASGSSPENSDKEPDTELVTISELERFEEIENLAPEPTVEKSDEDSVSELERFEEIENLTSEPTVENTDRDPGTELVSISELNSLHLSEEDIDNFLSEPSLQYLITSESVASIASLFSHLDELNLIQREIVDKDQNVVENCIVAKNIIDNKTYDQEQLKEIVPALDNTPKTATKNSLSLEAVFEKIPQETTIKVMKQIQTDCSEIEQMSTDRTNDGPMSNENNRQINVETTIDVIDKETNSIPKNDSDIEEVLANFIEELGTPHLPLVKTELINLSFKETHMIRSNTPEILQTLDLSDQEAKESSVRESFTIPNIIAPKIGELSKAAPSNIHGLGCNSIIDLTISDDEVEKDVNIVDLVSIPRNEVTKRKETDNDLDTVELKSICTKNGQQATLNATSSPVCVTQCPEKDVQPSSNVTKTLITPLHIPEANTPPKLIPRAEVNEISICSTPDCDLDTININNIAYIPVGSNKPSKEDNEIVDSNDKSYDSDCCSGYHSSDFEFISENEASMCGLIINYRNKRNSKSNKEVSNNVSAIVATEETLRNSEVFDENRPGPSNYQLEPHYLTDMANRVIPQGTEVFDENRPGPSNYQLLEPHYLTDMANRAIPEGSEVLDENRPGPSNYQLEPHDLPDMANHVIPQGDVYLELFRGQYLLNVARYMENKSVFGGITSTMHIEYDALGPNIAHMREIQWDVGDQYRAEAQETARRIRETYSVENRRRRR